MREVSPRDQPRPVGPEPVGVTTLTNVLLRQGPNPNDSRRGQTEANHHAGEDLSRDGETATERPVRLPPLLDLALPVCSAEDEPPEPHRHRETFSCVIQHDGSPSSEIAIG